MKTQGFTLIELLAVIVILAIITLIATPIVLGIIDDTKESAQIRSAEMYLKGVANAVMKENMNSGGNFRPTECTITSEGNLDCDDKEGILEVEVDGEKPKNGTITFTEGKIKEVTLNYQSETIVKDINGNLVYEGKDSKITYESLDNWQHKTMDGVFEEHFDEDINGVCDLCNETEIPGLYKPDGTFVSWEQLTSMEYCAFEYMSGYDDEGYEIYSYCPIISVSNNTLEYILDVNGDCISDIPLFLDGKLVISKNVISLGDDAFYGCNLLSEIIMPDGLTSVGDEAFSQCTNLTKISIPNSLTTISHYMCLNAKNLKNIYYNGTQEQWNAINFKDKEWNEFCPEITVHCTDGDIVIPAYN